MMLMLGQIFAMVGATGQVERQGSMEEATQQPINQTTGPTPAAPTQEAGGRQVHGIKICTVNITNTSKRVMAWLAKLPYEVIMVQEHHKVHKKQ
eukprot:12235037-Karenia_brevis.AAC.1